MKGSSDERMTQMTEKNILAEIFEARARRLRETMSLAPPEEVRERAHARRASATAHAFRRALEEAGRANVIAEFKRASPSKGEIRAGASAREVAEAYERGGAAAVSVLTEEDYFRGSLRDLAEVREATRLPVIRKDFIFDDYQVFEAAAAGADALLLIAAMLDDDTLRRLRRLTEETLGMDALVEVHTAEEMRRAGEAGARTVGVNNRDLRTFKVSLQTSHDLARHAPADALLVSESGIRGPQDIAALRAAGYKAFLVGESLMRAERPEEALRSLIGISSPTVREG